MSCENLLAAALTLQRYEALLDGVNVVEFNIEGQQASMTWRPLVDNPPPAFIMLSMSLWANHARSLTERPDLTCDVSFTFDKPQSQVVQDSFDATFGGRVLFNQGTNMMTGPAHLLSLPIAQRDRHVHDSLRQRAEIDLHELLGEKYGFIEHLEAMIVDRLEYREVTLQDVARSLELAPRTVQNRLERLGITYREVLDRVRQRQAELYLSNPEMTLSEVTQALGFTQQSAFQHAFKRWKGTSPGNYRAQSM